MGATPESVRWKSGLTMQPEKSNFKGATLLNFKQAARYSHASRTQIVLPVMRL